MLDKSFLFCARRSSGTSESSTCACYCLPRSVIAPQLLMGLLMICLWGMLFGFLIFAAILVLICSRTVELAYYNAKVLNFMKNLGN